MDRAEIIDALRELGSELGSRGITADLYVVGGAAIALAYDDRRSTRDIDAVFVPKSEVYDAAERVRDRLNLPEGWLNDAGRCSRLRWSSSRGPCWTRPRVPEPPR